MNATINDKNLSGDAFYAAELNDLIGNVLDRSVVLENCPLAHGIDGFRQAPQSLRVGHPKLAVLGRIAFRHQVRVLELAPGLLRRILETDGEGA